jgi:TPR repeat protein
VNYCQLAADQNFAQAQLTYGHCVSEGRGVEIDLVPSAKCFKLAAGQNHAPAQFYYGVCLSKSRGVETEFWDIDWGEHVLEFTRHRIFPPQLISKSEQLFHEICTDLAALFCLIVP